MNSTELRQYVKTVDKHAILTKVYGAESSNTRTEWQSQIQLLNQVISLADFGTGVYDTLKATFEEGPLGDGCVPSKAARDTLLDTGMIAKTINKGEWGYNSCTYKGAWGYKLMIAMLETFPVQQPA